MNARDLITDAIVEKAARVEWLHDCAVSKYPDDAASWERNRSDYMKSMRVALEAVIDDLVGAVRLADWDDLLDGAQTPELP